MRRCLPPDNASPRSRCSLRPSRTPALVTPAVALQAVIALTCVLGGSAAWGGASLLSTLQKS